MRREPQRRRSGKARWSLWLAVLAALVGASAVIAYRSRAIGETAALLVVGTALALAVLALVSGFAAWRDIWQDGRRGFGVATTGLTMAVLILGYPALLAWRAVTLPGVTDIATDLASPPAFASVQRAAPDGDAGLIGRDYDADPQLVFVEVLDLIDDRGWALVRSEPPVTTTGSAAPGGAEADPSDSVGGAPVPPPPPPAMTEFALAPALAVPGIVEATAHTRVMGFAETIVVRVRPLATGARVDARSASEVLPVDFGTNAARIASFLADLDRRLPGLAGQ